MQSYLERTLKLLKPLNGKIQKVEYFNAHGGNRVDLYGFIDVLMIHPALGTWGIQVCGQDWSEHIKKMTGERREAVILWLASGNRCILVGWRKLKKTGWTPRVKEFTLADFPEITEEVLINLRNSLASDFDLCEFINRPG